MPFSVRERRCSKGVYHRLARHQSSHKDESSDKHSFGCPSHLSGPRKSSSVKEYRSGWMLSSLQDKRSLQIYEWFELLLSKRAPEDYCMGYSLCIFFDTVTSSPDIVPRALAGFAPVSRR